MTTFIHAKGGSEQADVGRLCLGRGEMPLYVRKVQEVRASLLLPATDFTVSCQPQHKFSWWRKDSYIGHSKGFCVSVLDGTGIYVNIVKESHGISCHWSEFHFLPKWTHYLGVCWWLVSLTVQQWTPSLTLKQQTDCVATSSCCTVRSLHAWIHTLQSSGVTVYTRLQGMKDDL